MPEEPITFEFIRKTHREEQKESKLSKIPENFYIKAKEYLEQKRKLSAKQKNRMSSLEVKNVERLLEDIYNRRETKITNHAIMTARIDIAPENLIEEEKKLFEIIVDSLKKQRERILNSILKKSKESFETVTFKEDVEEFMGINLKKYGPYKKGDKAKIPKENADLLIRAGKAQR
jgi:DNA replication factor GINS